MMSAHVLKAAKLAIAIATGGLSRGQQNERVINECPSFERCSTEQMA
jgi:hypothetical protein